MIDFSREPTPKSAEEKAFDELNEQYVERFGVPYVFAIGVDSFSWTETLTDIRQRIEQNNPQQKPGYEPGNIY